MTVMLVIQLGELVLTQIISVDIEGILPLVQVRLAISPALPCQHLYNLAVTRLMKSNN